MTVKNNTEVLKNGLTVIGESNPDSKSCGIGYFVKTGSRDETKTEAGISHFLEHMMFKGTESRSAIDVNLGLGSIGAQANAFTSDENTVYYSSIIPEYFDSLQELLTDMLRPSLLQQEFDTEKKVILEEIALYQDRPHFYLYENAVSRFFDKHSLANSVLGSTESVSNITSDMMKNYFSRRYAPSNMVLVATGNFDWNKFFSRAAEQTEKWDNTPATRSALPFSEKGKSETFTRKNLNQSHIMFMSPGCSARDEHRYELAVLSVIIGDGTGSRFFWELIDSGIADNASSESDEKDSAGVFTAYAGCNPSKVEEVSSIIRNIFDDILNFTDEDLERAKSKILTRIILNGELPMGRLMALGMEWNYRQNIHNLKTEIERIKAVSKGTVTECLKNYPLDFSEYRLIPA